MLNAMSQGRSGSMCTIHADSSAGVFRRIASYAVQAQERLPLEASNLLIAGAIHFVVHLDTESQDGYRTSAGNLRRVWVVDSGSSWCRHRRPPFPSDGGASAIRIIGSRGR